ncbi:MAG: amino acid permease [Bacillota bacterium]
MARKDKGLSARHIIVMALANVIGASFFLGSSVAIQASGPSVLLAYVFGGILVYIILFAMSEMTVANPNAGSFHIFVSKTFGQGTGFVVGWVYWTGIVLAMSSEAAAVAILVREWMPHISMALLASIIIIVVTLLNLLGMDRLSKLVGGLVSIKLLALFLFIIIAVLLIFGLFPGKPALGIGALADESFMPGGIMSLAGSMLIVLFAYAGFEVIVFTASEAKDPDKTIPKAIGYTVLCLIGLYILTFAVILPLVPTALITEDNSPIVTALNQQGIRWAGTAINIVLIAAILSTMVAAMFGLGRMIRTLCNGGLAPSWLRDNKKVPYKGIIFSGLAMLFSLGIGLLLPRVYLFLVSSGAFAMLFTYAAIMATHIKFRKINGCPPSGKCQLWGYPYTSIFVLIFLVIAIISMPSISGQESGLVMGIIIVAFYSICYLIFKFHTKIKKNRRSNLYEAELSTELSSELTAIDKHNHKTDREK